jgi:CheY-like chemotaxis protein
MGKKKILIAEDNNSNYELLYEILQFEFDIVRAVDGQEVIDLYKSEKPDLILMDICMPNINGYQATHAIRQLDPNIPIIAQSAHVFDDDKYLAIDAGCNRHINKPILIPELLDTIKEFLG